MRERKFFVCLDRVVGLLFCCRRCFWSTQSDESARGGNDDATVVFESVTVNRRVLPVRGVAPDKENRRYDGNDPFGYTDLFVDSL